MMKRQRGPGKTSADARIDVGRKDGRTSRSWDRESYYESTPSGPEPTQLPFGTNWGKEVKGPEDYEERFHKGM